MGKVVSGQYKRHFVKNAKMKIVRKFVVGESWYNCSNESYFGENRTGYG